MKRSRINKAIKEMEAFAKKYSFALPPFCDFTPQDWETLSSEYDEIRDNMLGWDITDYGSGDFEAMGFSLVTLRNGDINNSEKYPKSYAEKLIFIKEGQYSPMHFHWNKMEDIINRGGGTLIVKVYNSTKDGEFDTTDVLVSMDGRNFTVKAGSDVYIKPGESITIYPYMYHDFNVLEGSGDILLGEVSMCNDDTNDNRFYKELDRFSEIEEDEAPYRLLCNEYKKK